MYVKNVMTEYLSQKGNYSKQVTYKEVRAIEKKTYKYIIRSYEPFIERHPNFPIYFSIAVLVIVILFG